MTLTTHAIVGAATAQLFPRHPIIAFFAGFVSHFLIDAIPHWDYLLLSSKRDIANPLNNDIVIVHDSFRYDLLRIMLDFFLGILLSLLIFPGLGFQGFLVTLLGALGGIAPDPLQFLYFKIRREPITSLQRFHHWIHAKTKLTGRYILGISLQIILVGIAIYLAHIFG